MKLLISTLAVVLLSGCAAGCPSGFCPGQPAFEAVANYYDRRDPCQGDHRSSTAERRAELGRPDDYTRPDWCFASRGKNIRIDRNASPNSYTITRY